MGSIQTLELFAGTCSFSKAAQTRGMQTFTSDFDASFNTDYTVDIMQFDINKLPYKPNVIWASPPCETYSVASIGRHWNKDRTPKTPQAVEGERRILKTLAIIDELKPDIFIIENPRGMLRKMSYMQSLYRYTVTYCQYGDTRMKPTDLWSNRGDLIFKPACKNGMPCHISAPRGSRTGTQGIKTYKDRSRIPEALVLSVADQCAKILKRGG